MSWTLESGACSQCQTENSKHIDNCHSCGVALPWAGSEMTQTEAFHNVGAPPEETEFQRSAGYTYTIPIYDIPTWARVILIVAGALLVSCGGFLWIADMLGIYPTIPGAGYFAFVLGFVLFFMGDRLPK